MSITKSAVHDDFNEAVPTRNELTDLTASIVVAYVSHNSVPAGGVPDLIDTVRTALAGVRDTTEPEVEIKLNPAVPIKKSLNGEEIFCLECGKSQISLKRHLKVAHDLAPAEYRAKWDLRTDYPMVAPEYSARRSALAKRLGLGRKPNAKGSPPKAKEARATSNRKT